ncbi:PAS domain-containing protein [uncultured Sphingomonas sp.]|uniref:PAS domain-containing protein n=1 Tax=uncultured Sphingomonas sp. TaxID=158754 RepID=UPI0025DE0DEA|nr:PAS domain-containing protein [uncultured Sphingomonas sp.]
MVRRVRAQDWAATPLGLVAAWSERLKAVVDLLLAAELPMIVLWGPELIQIYNDGYAKIMGVKHPIGLGQPTRDCWPEVWSINAPIYEQVLAGGAVTFENALYPLTRSGVLEDAWFTLSYSPVRDESGAVAGVLVTLIETTGQVLARRERAEVEARQAFLLKLSDTLRGEPDADAVAYQSLQMLFDHLRLDRCYITYYRPEDDEADFPYQVGNDTVPPLPAKVRLSDFPDAYEQVLEKTFVIEDDFERRGLSNAERASSTALGMRAMLASTVRRGEKNPLCSMAAVSSRPRHWTPAEIALVEEVAERTWAAIERARGEGALRDSETRFRALATAGSYLIYRMSPDWRLMYQLEGGALAPTEAPIEDWIDKYILPEDLAQVNATVAEAIRTKSMFELEHRVRAADGGIAWVLSRAVPILGSDGEIVEWFGAGADVTERRRVQEALRESEARLIAAFESVPVGAAIINMDGNVVVSNAEYRRFLPSGLMPSRHPKIAAQWRAWDMRGHPLELDDFPGARAMRGESVVPGQEMVFTDENGQETWTSVATAPTRDEGGRVTGAVSVIADIDVAKRSADALRQSEERFRQFGEASQDILWIRNAKTLQWEYLTPAFEVIYGVSRQEALAGENMRNWLDLIVPEDRPLALENLRQVRAGEQVAFEYRVRRPSDGAIRWLRNTDFPIRDESGEVTLIGGVGHDLTELRETGLRLRALMEGIPQLVWRAVDGGHWTWASPQWTAFTGQEEADSHGSGWLKTLHPDDHDVARDAWDHAMERGGIDVEYRICTRDARSYRWFQTRATPVRDEAGSIIEWLGTSTDIHDLRLLQDRQQVMVQELQHRTRNLITVVNALSKQTLKSATSLSDFDVHFKDRLSALSRVQGLLSHLSAGKRVTFDELLGSELAALGAPDDKVTLDGPEGVPLKSATVQTFSLALHELATNALKYGALAAPDGHLTVRWGVIHADRDGPRLQVDWRETGVVMTHVSDRPRVGGYGRELIERALPYQLGAKTSYEMATDGVHCTIDVPASTATAEPD